MKQFVVSLIYGRDMVVNATRYRINNGKYEFLDDDNHGLVVETFSADIVKTIECAGGFNLSQTAVGRKVAALLAGRKKGASTGGMPRWAASCRAWWLIRQLRNQSYSSSERSVAALVKCGSAAVSQLVSALSAFHPHELSDEFRPKDPASGIVLSYTGEFKSYGVLRQCAAEALGKIGDPRAVEPILELLVSTHRRALCSALSQAKGLAPSTLNHSEDVDMVLTAISALSAIGDDVARAGLLEALGLTAFPEGVYTAPDCDRICTAIVKSLARFGEHEWSNLHQWDDIYKIDDTRVTAPLRFALKETEYLSPLVNWDKQKWWAVTAGDIARKLKTLGDTGAIEALTKARTRVLVFGRMFKLSDTEPRDEAIRRIDDAIDSLQKKAKIADAGLLVLVFAKSQEVTPQLVKAAAGQAGYVKGRIQTIAGPTSITAGQAEALLAQIDTREGTAYLSQPFTTGSGTASGVSFAFIKVP